MAAKRKKLTLRQKIDIIRDVEKNNEVPLTEMAKNYDLAPSTLFGIIKQKDAILNAEVECGPEVKLRKNIRCSPYEELESILMKWFEGKRSENAPIDGNILKEKSRKIALRMGLVDFQASNGWFNRFKKRHNISFQSMCGESAEVSDGTVDFWKKTTLPRLLEGYDAKNIFNADETGVFYNLLPSKTYAVRGEKCHGGKKSKERFTALLCVNSDGSEKLPPLIIGKFKNPRCFKNIRTLPCKYDFNKNAWMTSEIFVKFLRSLDAQMGSSGRKIVLVVDRCPAHPADTSFLRNIKVIFFPPNCTSRLQPLDLGIIHSLKVKYRKALVQRAISFLERNEEMKLNIFQAMHMLVAAWQQVSTDTVRNCFGHAGFGVVSGVIDEDNADDIGEDWKVVTKDNVTTFREFVTCDDDVLTSAPLMNIEDICDDTMNPAMAVAEEEDDEENPPEPTFAAAVEGLDIVRRYLSSFSVDEGIISNLNQVERDLLSVKHLGKKKQSTLLDYFRK